eukprot:CAMPEP_0197848634 /NCGR_PEP_ID=MMETSP1438-20131217/9412_1 /TAXON_ID=1461541 /ORGANISM="Pterosperma sp., Strain CCMP1384" /LENGTH=673 /DNA_ID=CAMNT_0043460977 /DNA_START=279 /DNA_END=2300 /DNA_ORIENTATION=+
MNQGNHGPAGLPVLNLAKVKQSLEGAEIEGALSNLNMNNATTPRGTNKRQSAGGTSSFRAHQPVQDKKLSMGAGLQYGFGGHGGVDEPQTARQRTNSSQKMQAPRQPVTARPSTLRTPSTSYEDGRQSGATNSRNSANTPTNQQKLPMTAATALKLHSNTLTEFEQSEILEYPQIYFTGHNCPNKIRASPHIGTHNHGYDDERGDYTTVLHDHICFRYEVLKTLGKGSFGQVMQCFDYKTNTLRAVKIIRNKKRFHHQALVEVKILEHLRHKDQDDSSNIIHMCEYFYFRNHLCISFELLSLNLYEFIKNNNFQGLSLGLIRRFAQQLLISLRFLRHQRVIHCDLKPENILLRAPNKSSIKVIDFGSSCFEDERVYTYIQSRFYRSPEVILGLPYDMGIDMWSFGCILAELYTGYPLFPGENEVEQLACIMEILNVPPRDLLELATRKKMFFDSNNNPRIVPNSRGKKRRPGMKDLASALRCNDAAFLDFLEGCLQWDVNSRLTPQEALQHQWINDGQAQAQSSHRSHHYSQHDSVGPRHKKTTVKHALAGPAAVLSHGGHVPHAPHAPNHSNHAPHPPSAPHHHQQYSQHAAQKMADHDSSSMQAHPPTIHQQLQAHHQQMHAHASSGMHVSGVSQHASGASTHRGLVHDPNPVLPPIEGGAKTFREHARKR